MSEQWSRFDGRVFRMVSRLECKYWDTAAFRSGRQLPITASRRRRAVSAIRKVLSLTICGVGSCQVIVAQLKFQSKQIRILPDIAQTSATADVGRTDPRFPDGMLIQQSFPLLGPLLGRRCGYTESHPDVCSNRNKSETVVNAAFGEVAVDSRKLGHSAATQ